MNKLKLGEKLELLDLQMKFIRVDMFCSVNGGNALLTMAGVDNEDIYKSLWLAIGLTGLVVLGKDNLFGIRYIKFLVGDPFDEGVQWRTDLLFSGRGGYVEWEG